MRLSEDRIAVLAKLVSNRLLDEELVDLEIAENDFTFLLESMILCVRSFGWMELS